MTSVTGGTVPGRLGIFGGTFDPPHIGHLVAALSVREQLGLHEVWLVPNGDPWQKRGTRVITPAAVRLEMARAAVAGVPGVEVSDIEVRRAGPSYTIDTIEALQAEDAGRALVVVLGADAAAGLPTWHRHRDVLAAVSLAVLDRGDTPPGPGDGEEGEGDLAAARREPVAMRRIDVSSTELRERVRQGRSVDVLVPAAVLAVVDRHGLYRDPST